MKNVKQLGRSCHNHIKESPITIHRPSRAVGGSTLLLPSALAGFQGDDEVEQALRLPGAVAARFAEPG